MKRCSVPSWTQFVDVGLEEANNSFYQQQLSISVYKVDAKGHHIRELGVVTFGLQDLYSARWRRMTFEMQSRANRNLDARSVQPSVPVAGEEKRPRLSICAVEKAPTRAQAWVRMQFQATDIRLNNPALRPAATPNRTSRRSMDLTPGKDTAANGSVDESARALSSAGRPNTYIQLSRQLQGFLQPFYRSEILERDCNPCWKDQGVSMQQFCAGNEDCTIAIELYQTDEMSNASGGRYTVIEQREDLQLGALLLTAKEIIEAGQSQKDGNIQASTFEMEETNSGMGGGRGNPLLSVLQLVTYFPEKGTQRRELHLEDKHFASDREFLSELLGANAVKGDVAEKVAEAQR